MRITALVFGAAVIAVLYFTEMVSLGLIATVAGIAIALLFISQVLCKNRAEEMRGD